MKQKVASIIALFILTTTFAQLSLTNTDNGIVTVSYGATGDWSLYDPGYDQVYIYLWVPEVMNSNNTYYGDDWNNSASLITLTWDGSKHAGTIDLNTHSFNGTVIPTNTVVSNFMLILRNEAGNGQSGDLTASDFGFSSATLPVDDFSISRFSVSFENDLFLINDNKETNTYNVQLFDTLGRKIESFNTNNNQFQLSNLSQSLYYLIIENNKGEVLKQKLYKN